MALELLLNRTLFPQPILFILPNTNTATVRRMVVSPAGVVELQYTVVLQLHPCTGCRLSTATYLEWIDQAIAPVTDPAAPPTVACCSPLRSCDPLPVAMVGRLQKHPAAFPVDALDVFLRLAPQAILELFLVDSIHALHYLRRRSHISPSQPFAVPYSEQI